MCVYVCVYVCISVWNYVWIRVGYVGVYVGVSVCVYMCVSVCVYVCVLVCVYARKSISLPIFRSTPCCMCVCVFVCVYTRVYTCAHACAYVCVYVCTYMCTYMCEYACKGMSSAISRGIHSCRCKESMVVCTCLRVCCAENGGGEGGGVGWLPLGVTTDEKSRDDFNQKDHLNCHVNGVIGRALAEFCEPVER